MELKDLGTVLQADVLVIGGGMGGLSAAICAKEQGADVLIVEKMTVGFAGMASRAGNGILSLTPDDDIEEYVEYLSRNLGKYITDQDALRRQASMISPSLYKLRDWGVGITKDANGDIGYWKHIYAPWRNTGIEINCTEVMRERALKDGVRIKNNIQVTGLLKSTEGKVNGAVGFNIKDGSFHIFRAKSVILACSGCGFRSTRMFNGRGEGIKLAFDAGAQMRNAEYGNMTEVSDVASGESVYGTCAVYISPMYVYNQKGENVWKKYVKWSAPDVVHEVILGMEQEYREGNGPLYIDMQKLGEATDEANAIFEEANPGTEKYVRFFPEKMKYFAGRLMQREGEYFTHHGNPVVKPGLHGNLGCVRTDVNMMSTIDGLFAVGLDSYNGSSAYGAIPQPGGQRGNGLGMAAVTGMIGGEEAGKYVQSIHKLSQIDLAQVELLKKEAYASLEHSGDIPAHDILERIQDAYTPFKYSFRRSDESLRESIELFEGIKADLPKMKATDYHELLVCNEMKAMALAGEIAMRSALERKESRGFHYREDYPETDNENWLKWVLAEKEDGKVSISTEDIPIESYKYHPESGVPKEGASK